MPSYVQFNLRLQDHYLIFVDTDKNEVAGHNVVNALKEMGASKATASGFTLSRSKVQGIEQLISVLGAMLASGTDIWISYEEGNELKSCVITYDASIKLPIV